MFRGKRFRGRRRLRWWRKQEQNNRKHRGILVRLGDWWNRRQFYTFHKDEIITQADTCPSPTLAERHKEAPVEEDEWNNESESDDAGDLASNDGSMEDYTDQDPSDYDLESDEGNVLETIHEEVSLESSPPRTLSKIIVTPSPPRKPTVTKPVSAQRPPPSSLPSSLKLYQKGPTDSISGSLESIDSLVSSHCDDEASTMTPLITNVAKGVIQTNDVFFDQHLRFLQVQTQPSRQVEEVYHSSNEKKEGTIEE